MTGIGTGMVRTGADRDPDAFTASRERLWGIAYRICGTRADADDVVQDAWLRWDATDTSIVERPEAWLTTVTGRLAIDRLRARRRRGEHYVGPWLPEMIAVPASPDHSDLVESLTVGFLTLLERLDPVERAVFLLADVFGERFADIAATVGRSETACRQIASRARKRVHDGTRRRPAPPSEQRRLADAFALAAFTGDLAGVRALLTDDSVLLSDGGAATHAARRPVVGPDRIARFVVNLSRRHGSHDATAEAADINGEPGLIVRVRNRATFAMVVHVVECDDGVARVEQVFGLRNPDKLVGFAGASTVSRVI